MRIGISARKLSNKMGGTRRYVENMIPALLEVDRENEYVILYDTPRLLGSYPLAKEVVLDIPTKVLWDYVGLPAVVRQESIDLLWCPTDVVPFTVPCKSVAVFFDLLYLIDPGVYKTVDSLHMRLAIPMSVRKADAAICISEHTRRDLVRLFPAATNKAHVVYLAADPRYTHIKSSDLLRRIAVKHHLPDPFVLYVGSISPRKNVARLLRAFAEWKKRCGSGHKLVLVGTGKQWKSQEDFRLIKQPGIAEHVVLVEYVSDEDLVGIYNLADLLIYPSLYEGFGLPILEAMACGCPVITSKVSSMPEVAGDAAILIDPEDEVGLCGAIDRVLVQPRLRQDLIAKGFERVQQFSWQRAATQTLQIIRQVAGQ